jgi:hypothetical protein
MHPQRANSRWSYICSLLVALFAFAASEATAQSLWINRTVTAVDGEFNNMQPRFGFEVGEGTSRVQWGQPLSGSFSSFLRFEGYDALPGFDQPWFFGGQTVAPGQSFLAAALTFGNGTVSTTSSAPILTVDLDVSAFGAEFMIDNHPFSVSDTWEIEIRNTPNAGLDPVADADYIFFRDFPHLGSFRVFEGQQAGIHIHAAFGSLSPVAFGAVSNPSVGVWVPSIVNDPRAPGVPPPVTNSVPESSSLIAWALVAAFTGAVKYSRRRLIHEPGIMTLRPLRL